MSKIIKFPCVEHKDSDDDVEGWWYCEDCIDERPDDVSLDEFSKIKVGRTKDGVRIWCNRHNQTIINIKIKNQGE